MPRVKEMVPDDELVILEILIPPSLPSVRKQFGLVVLLKVVRPDSLLKNALPGVPLTPVVPFSR
jgi:hypothetical protein